MMRSFYHAAAILTLSFFVNSAIHAVDLSTMEEFHSSPNFIYFAEADENYSELVETMELRSIEFERKFGPLPAGGAAGDDRVKIYVFESQSSFRRHVFNSDDPSLDVTGLADHVAREIYITSYFDGCRPKKRLLQTAVHELVHIYLPHSYIYVREGVACYFSDMLEPLAEEDIPRRFTDMRFYVDGPEETAKAYFASSWMMKYIFEECLERDMNAFRAWMAEPEDYALLGYADEPAFFAAWGDWLRREFGYI